MKEAFPFVPGPTDEVAFTAVDAGAEVASAIISPGLAAILIAFIGFRWFKSMGKSKA
jgi:hypothetical protein